MHTAQLTPRPLKPAHFGRHHTKGSSGPLRRTMKIINPEVKATADGAEPRPLPDLSRLQGIMFDIDGTLVDSDPLHFKAFEVMLAQAGYNNGVPITREWYNSTISGKHNPVLMKELFPDWSVERQAEFADQKEATFREQAASILKPLPGLLELFDWMDQTGLKRVAVTNAPKANAYMMLDALGVRDRFQAVILGEECARAKPFPDPYLKGLKLLGTKPEETIVCEDSPSGIAAAVAAGVAAIGVTTGHSAEGIKKLGASYAIDDYHQLLALLKEAARTPVAA